VSSHDSRLEELVDQIATIAQRKNLSVGVAESLTGGQISTALAAGTDAAQWYRGSVVAYASEVKFDLLGVPPGPVNTAACASRMAAGTHSVLGCDVAVSATGVGGPGPDEDVPPGTVFIACSRQGCRTGVGEHHLEGAPGAVIGQAVELALDSVLQALLEDD
jgi:nicotinamide-nucleotide amidase